MSLVGIGVPCFRSCPKDRRIVVRRLIVSEHDADAGFQEELPEHALVLCLTPAVRENGSKLAQHDEGHQNLVGLLEDLDRLIDALTEVDIPIRVERDPHRQRSSSTRS